MCCVPMKCNVTAWQPDQIILSSQGVFFFFSLATVLLLRSFDYLSFKDFFFSLKNGSQAESPRAHFDSY